MTYFCLLLDKPAIASVYEANILLSRLSAHGRDSLRAL